MDVKDFRRQHLSLNLSKFKTIEDFCEEYDLTANYIRQLNTGSRNIGHKKARELEGKVGDEKNSWDLPPAIDFFDELAALDEQDVGAVRALVMTLSRRGGG